MLRQERRFFNFLLGRRESSSSSWKFCRITFASDPLHCGGREEGDTQRSTLCVLHVIREETAAVVRQDFSGLRVQFQGDRIQAVFLGEEHKVARMAVQATIGLQSSMEGPIKQFLPEAQPLHLAIGIDLGRTLLSRLGIRAYRDPICIGQPVERAAAFEEISAGGEIAISQRLYRALPLDLKSHFERRRQAHCSIAGQS